MKSKSLSQKDVPSFTTDRLIVKGINLNDAQAYQKYFNDYDVISQLSAKTPWPYPEDGALSYIRDVIIPNQAKDKWYWGIFLKSNPHELIGAISLWRKGTPGNRGFWLAKKHWGKGIMTEALDPIMDYAFNNLKFRKLVLTNALGNNQSRRIKEKTGAIFIEQKPAKFVDPKYTEREVWELTKAQWLKHKSGQQLHERKTTIESAEVQKFDELASSWWDLNGKFKMLHTINPLRIKYIKEQVCQVFGTTNESTPFTGLRLLDIGCGGGLISVPMHHLGAQVTAIDASPNNILTAKKYCHDKRININFCNIAVEELTVPHGQLFHVILALEVIEHVSDYQYFLEKITKLLQPQGLLIISTINRTFKSLLFAKIGAEYILRWLPIGTHDWNKFLSPTELENELTKFNLIPSNLSGMVYQLHNQKWVIGSQLSSDINYLMTFKKQ